MVYCWTGHVCTPGDQPLGMRDALLPGVAAGGIEGGLRVCRVRGWYRVVVDHGPSTMKGTAQATIPPTDEVLLSETPVGER
jgi:hypothetical protein